MTTRGTQDQKPSNVEAKRTKDNGSIDVVVRWNVHEVTETDEETGEERTEWEYGRAVLRDVEAGVPESEINNWLDANEAQLTIAGKIKKNDLTTTEMEKIIDYETGKAIDSALHPIAGVEEALGIVRDLLEKNINAGYIESTSEFDVWHEKAVEKVNEGQKKKEDL